MATAKLTKTWTAIFTDGTRIVQTEEDKYSKHDDSSEWNPSAFRDVIDKGLENVKVFTLDNVSVLLDEGAFLIDFNRFSLESEPLNDRKLIYYRVIERKSVGGLSLDPVIVKYAVGYEGKNSNNKVIKKVVFING